ncbi:unnamed protein product [Arabidopsis arenosa]|uniref:Uncharacterized protein n=1 Tax=Arabidopsis arenosa TaxID=38785 RepID=A0A8S2AVQ0_ARAAE|nr:unnamed protein product [Arabidopsis arenosa]
MFSPSTSSSRVLPVAFYSGGSEKSFMDPAIGALDCEAVDCLMMAVPVLPEVSGFISETTMFPQGRQHNFSEERSVEVQVRQGKRSSFWSRRCNVFGVASSWSLLVFRRLWSLGSPGRDSTDLGMDLSSAYTSFSDGTGSCRFGKP